MNKYQLGFLISVLMVFALGLVMVFDTTSAEVLHRDLDKATSFALVKQIFYAFVGIFGALLVWFLGYENIIKFCPFFQPFRA